MSHGEKGDDNVAQKSQKYTERWGNTDFTDETDKHVPVIYF